MSVMHNIQIGVNVDEESIINGVKQAAIADIQRAIFGEIITSRWSGKTFTREFTRDFLEGYMDKVFDDERLRESIVKFTAENIAERLARSTKFKEKVCATISDNALMEEEQ